MESGLYKQIGTAQISRCLLRRRGIVQDFRNAGKGRSSRPGSTFFVIVASGQRQYIRQRVEKEQTIDNIKENKVKAKDNGSMPSTQSRNKSLLYEETQNDRENPPIDERMDEKEN